jgi:hypothetical protein
MSDKRQITLVGEFFGEDIMIHFMSHEQALKWLHINDKYFKAPDDPFIMAYHTTMKNTVKEKCQFNECPKFDTKPLHIVTHGVLGTRKEIVYLCPTHYEMAQSPVHLSMGCKLKER